MRAIVCRPGTAGAGRCCRRAAAAHPARLVVREAQMPLEDPDGRQARIRRRAYEIWQRSGGDAAENWRAAEAEIAAEDHARKAKGDTVVPMPDPAIGAN